MPTISAPNAAIIRSRQMRIPLDSFFVNIPPLVELATADIQTTPSTYPAYDFAITNTSANWTDPGVAIESQLVRIFKPSGKLAYEGILRRNATSVLLRLPAQNKGDTGIARHFAQQIEAGDSVVIYDTRRPGSQMSFLDPVTEEQYKRYDDEYDDGTTYGKQTVYPKPVVNMGTHQHKVINPSAGTAVFDLDGSSSYSWNGNSLDYEWELPSGVTITSGLATDDSITVQADPGAWQIALRVEDSVTGKLKRGYRYLYATDGKSGTYPAFSDTYPLVSAEEEHTQSGRNMIFRFKVNRSNTDLVNRLYLGAQLYACWSHSFSEDAWQTQDAPTAGLIEEYTGYVRSYEYEIDARGIKTVVVRCEHAMQFFGALPIAGQLIKESTAPTSWQEVDVDLNNLAFYVYYVFEYHAPSILQLSDFDYGDFDTLRMFGINIPAGSVANAARFVVNSRPGANIGCTSSGTITMRRHPWVESSSYRNAVPVVWTLTAADVKERLGFSLNPIMRNGLTYGSGFVWGAGNTTAAYKAWTGGFAMAQGVNRATMQDFTASNEAEVLSLVGHWHQLSNAPVETIDLEILSSRDVFDPVLMEVYELDLEDYDPADADLSSEIFNETQRAICTQIRRSWVIDNDAIIHRLMATFQPETSGYPAMIVPELERGSGLVDLPDAPAIIDCVDWGTVGSDTPFGWASLGVISTSGWAGTLTDLDGTYTAARGMVSGLWLDANAAVTPSRAGISRTFSLPTVVTSIDFEMGGNVGNSKRMAIVVKLEDDTYEVLNNTSFGGGVEKRTISWSGTRTAKEVLFLAISGTTTTNPAYVSQSCINGA